jgi:cytochrome c oxidase subunit 2
MGSSLFLAAAGPQTQNVSMFDPASPPAESIKNLTILVLAISGFIFVVVEGVLIYCVVRFRQPADGKGEPPQVYGSKSIEIAWTAAPALIVAMLTLVTARSLWEVNIDPPEPKKDDNALYVTVIGRQWWWEYRYDHYNGAPLGFTTANELHVPVSDDTPRKVYLTLKTADVCHSFWVPRLAGKTDLIAGKTNSMWFQPAMTGLYVGQCAEFCGTQHANMLLRVVVDSPQDFAEWLQHERSNAADDPELYDAQKTFLSQSCVSCHAVRGPAPKGTYAPDLTHLMSRKTLASGMIENDSEGKNLTDWLNNPQKIKPGCLMPAFGLTGRERDDVLRYLKSLK